MTSKLSSVEEFCFFFFCSEVFRGTGELIESLLETFGLLFFLLLFVPLEFVDLPGAMMVVSKQQSANQQAQ